MAEQNQSFEVFLDEEQVNYLSTLGIRKGESVPQLVQHLLNTKINEIRKANDSMEHSEKEFSKKPVSQLTNSEKILKAVKALSKGDLQFEFSRNDVRLHIGVSSHDWLNSYTAIFQAMRGDHPGGAPPISEMYQGVFRRVRRGIYMLTAKGQELITDIK